MCAEGSTLVRNSEPRGPTDPGTLSLRKSDATVYLGKVQVQAASPVKWGEDYLCVAFHVKDI